jgi:hypothetical protein
MKDTKQLTPKQIHSAKDRSLARALKNAATAERSLLDAPVDAMSAPEQELRKAAWDALKLAQAKLQDIRVAAAIAAILGPGAQSAS